MMKRLLISLSIAAAFSLVPVSADAAIYYYYLAGVAELSLDPDVEVAYSDGVLQVTGAEGQVVEVVSLTGKRVLSIEVTSSVQKIELNIPKGCYIVKVGNVVRKVSVR